VTANNVSAALSFRNQEDAQANLSALRVKPEIREGVVYDEKGKIFATFFAPGENTEPAFLTKPSASDLHKSFSFERLEEISFDGAVIGSIYLRSDTSELNSAVQRAVVIACLVLVCAVFIAAILSSRMQRMISTPILDLLATVRKVGSDKNY